MSTTEKLYLELLTREHFAKGRGNPTHASECPVCLTTDATIVEKLAWFDGVVKYARL